MGKTKKMTIKYWNSLSESTKIRAINNAIPCGFKGLEKEKPNLKDPWWELIFKKVRIPADNSHYKIVVNGWYMC